MKLIAALPRALLLFLCVTAMAYGAEEHTLVAQQFIKFLGSDKQITQVTLLESNLIQPSEPPVVAGYLVSLNNGGYIMVSPSRELTPVKAYSLSTDFYVLPAPYRQFLLREMEANARAVNSLAKASQPLSLSDNQKKWDFLMYFGGGRAPQQYTADRVLVTSRWNQNYPYNRFLPQADGETVLAGCVNIALGQLMRYHRHPLSGQGVVSYTWNGQMLKAVLYRAYNWESMPAVLDPLTPDYQVDEVANLIRDLGVANHTDFGVAASSTAMNRSLIENFGYSTNMQTMDNSNPDLFFTTLKSEIDAERPVLLTFPGHMAIADGYGSDGSGRKIHVNMGWGGLQDNFYFLDNVQGFPPNASLSINYNVKPCSGADCAADMEAGDSMNAATIEGVFNYPGDQDAYRVYLKGPTSINGTRGYNGTLAFYLSLWNDQDGESVFSTTGNVAAGLLTNTLNLPPGRYTMTISLCGEDGSCWLMSPGFNNYTLSFTTQTLTNEEKAAVDSALDVAPVLNNSFTHMVLDASNPDPRKILIDGRDENGDAVTINVVSTNVNAVQAALSNNVLTLTPAANGAGLASRIIVSATAQGKKVEKSFIVMVLNEPVSFGKDFEVKGLFENQSDSNTHRVILDGACTISGYNGYANQAFYSSAMDSQGASIVAPGDQTMNHAFPRNLYLLGASLAIPGMFYEYTQGENDRYSLHVTCPDASEDLVTIAGILGVNLGQTDYSTHTVSLRQGWNFISLPLLPFAQTIGEILEGLSSQAAIVWGYNNENKEWLKYRPNHQDSRLTSMEPGKGYWIYMLSQRDLNVPGTTFSSGIPLFEGWNLVGYIANAESRTLMDSLAPVGDKWIIAWGWEDEGSWKGKARDPGQSIPGQPLTDLLKGKAYWIKIKKGSGLENWTQ